MPHEGAAESGGDNTPPITLSSLDMEGLGDLYYDACLNGKKVVACPDPGASHIFMSDTAARQCGLTSRTLPENVEAELGDKSKVAALGIAEANLNIEGVLSNASIYIMPMCAEKSSKSDSPEIIIGRTWLREHNPDIDWRTSTIQFTHGDGSRWLIRPRGFVNNHAVEIKKISLKKMAKLVAKKSCEFYAIRVRPEMDQMKFTSDFKDIVAEFDDVFLDELPDGLPPNRDVEFSINLKSEQPPPVRPVIRLSKEELKELKRQLKMLLDKKLIRPSSSPYGAPVFFVKKKNGDLRMVCDYRALNKITIPDANPLPLIDEAIDQVSDAIIFSQFDLIGAYHQMRIREEDCHKTAIRTRFGSFEWRVLCFGLTNAPAAFTGLLSSLLHDMNGDFLVLFLDDVLVYSKSIEEHKAHLRRLFETLRKHKLYAKRSKCNIEVQEVDFLGFKIGADGVKMQSRLVDGILEWPTPRSVRDVRSFIGMSNFYLRFIKVYPAIVTPMS